MKLHCESGEPQSQHWYQRRPLAKHLIVTVLPMIPFRPILSNQVCIKADRPSYSTLGR